MKKYQSNFTALRILAVKRQQRATRMNLTAQYLLAVVFLGVWTLVGVSIFNNGPWLMLTILAIVSTLIEIPLVIIVTASQKTIAKKNEAVIRIGNETNATLSYIKLNKNGGRHEILFGSTRYGMGQTPEDGHRPITTIEYSNENSHEHRRTRWATRLKIMRKFFKH
jgi:hypothetical protein